MSVAQPLTVRVYRMLQGCWPARMTVEQIAAELGQPRRSVARAVQHNEATGLVRRSLSDGVRGALFQVRT